MNLLTPITFIRTGLVALALFGSPLRAELWMNPTDEADGWKQIDWFGWISEAEEGWHYHLQHGWLFTGSETESSIWFWSPRLGWLWTGSQTYPYLYHGSGASWLYYLEGSEHPRYFFHFGVQDWAALHSQESAPVEHSIESWDWSHQTFSETTDHQLLGYDLTTSVRTFDLTVVENDWIRIKILPDWGGRILSIYSKSLDYEMLYYPRAGARSDMIHVPGAFYYDWILLAYGINPTFPEGEHGKYWGVPWPIELKVENDERVTFRMTMIDDVDWPAHPGKFDNGRTDLSVAMDITIFRDRSYVEVAYTLTNTRDETIAYEFWTPAAFAPTRLTDSRIPPDTDIVMNHDRILVKDWWNWIARTETNDSTRGDDTYLFDKLRHLPNWKGSGIAYAYPLLEIPWFGVINQSEGFGAMRTADDPDAAPGMKIWATGSDSLMFELWSGHSSEFFNDAYLEPHAVRQWKEFYLPFAGLTEVSHATKYGVVLAQFGPTEEGQVLELDACGTIPTDVWRVRLRPVLVNGMIEPVILDFLVSFGPDGSVRSVSHSLPLEAIPADLAEWDFEITEAFSGEPRMRFQVSP